MENNIVSPVNPIKQYIKDMLDANLQDFELVKGGQQRTVGDLIEDKVSEIFYNSKNTLISEVRPPRSARSIEDFTLVSNGVSYYIDPKTHDTQKEFSMPNLTSIERIRKLFKNDNEEVIYVLVSYAIKKGKVTISDIKVFFVWELDISILSVGNLGNGQLQISNAKNGLVFTEKGKEGWFDDFRLLVQSFLKKQLIKFNKQVLKWQ